jgi:hypothetical protein
MLTATAHITDTDHGAKALIDAVKSVTGATIETGLFEGEQHPDTEKTVAEIGGIHEFGSRDGKIRERSWLRRAAREYGDAWDARMDKVRDAVVGGGKLFPNLIAFGERVASDVRATIDEVMEPLKAESTLRHEGPRFTHPLIWQGIMRACVRSRIVLMSATKMTPKGRA